MKKFRSRLAGASAGVLFAWFAGAYFVGTLGIALAMGTSHLVLLVISHAIGAALFGGIMTAIFVIQRRRSGGTHKFVQLNEILASGAVPDDVNSAELVPELSRRRKALRRSLVFGPLVLGAFALLGVFIVAQDPSVVVLWIFTPLFVILGIVSVVQARSALRKIDSVLAQIEPEPTAPADDGAL